MSDYFVTPTGAGVKDGSNWENADDSIADGYAAVSSGDTVYIGTGTYVLPSYLLGQRAATDVTFFGSTIGTGTTVVAESPANVIITTDSDEIGVFRLHGDVTTSTWIFRNLQIQSADATRALGIIHIDGVTAGTGQTAGPSLRVYNCIINNDDVDSVDGCIALTNTNGCKQIGVFNSTLSSQSECILASYDADIILMNSNFYHNNDTTSRPILFFGDDSDYTNTNNMGPIIIDSCTIKYLGARGQHALGLFTGCENAQISDCWIETPCDTDPSFRDLDFGIVCKGDGITIKDCFIKGNRAVYFKASNACKVVNCTLVAGSGSSLSCGVHWANVDDGGVTYAAEYNIIKNCIIDSSLAPYALVFSDTGSPSPATGHNNTLLQNNSYYGYSTALLYDGVNAVGYGDTNTQTDIVTVLDQFDTWGSLYESNADGGIYANPQFKDADNDDYTPTNPHVIEGGMGAVEAETEIGYRARYN